MVAIISSPQVEVGAKKTGAVVRGTPEEGEEVGFGYLASRSDGRSAMAGAGTIGGGSGAADFAGASSRANNAASPACSGS
jgi:hypothetical protein